MSEDFKKRITDLRKNLFYTKDQEKVFPISPKPKVIHLAVSRVCNVDCIMCPINREVLKDKENFLDFGTFIKAFQEGKDFDSLTFVGAGEVFMAKDFPLMLKYCFEKNFSALGCITNLQLVSPELAELMVKNKFHQLSISIDGCTKETFEYIRRGSKFEKTIQTIELFNELKRRYRFDNPHFTFTAVAMNSNIHELPGLVELAHKYGVKHIYVARLHVSNEKEGILNESLYFHQEKYNRYYDETIELSRELGINIDLPPKFGLPPIQTSRKVRDCKMPFEGMYIDVDGIVYPCVCRVYPNVFIGNIKDDSLLILWNSEKFNNFRKAMFSNSPPKQCHECTFSVLDPNKPESHMTPELAKKVKENIQV